MTLSESVHCGVNLLGVAIVGLSGFAFLPEVFFENDVPDKIDDGVLFLLSLAGIWWYRRGRNRFARSIAPVALVALALATKIGALLVEFDDPSSAGDDFGALILFVLALGLVWRQYRQAPRLAESAN
ncbi:MAG: hypothetical protein KGI78_02135 [Patescibacteria group bacterium]|nr:hypothetical protein [Patescibacteria group bacterium]MDE1944287.1 hypothetical protein [Patescibacteria group bacterium]MDE1945124.1 hypothetical protein [Patescibacteria group bacterium]MDE2057632.1 hypothetical protein [Patescibacteria group bacterium]